MIYDDQPQMVDEAISAYLSGPVVVQENVPQTLHAAFAAIDREALIEKVAPALWEVRRQRFPGKGEGMTPPWGDHYSGQTVEYYEMTEAALVAAGVIPEES